MGEYGLVDDDGRRSHRVRARLRREMFDRMLIFNEKYLTAVLAEYDGTTTRTDRISLATSDRPPSTLWSPDRSPIHPKGAPFVGGPCSQA